MLFDQLETTATLDVSACDARGFDPAQFVFEMRARRVFAQRIDKRSEGLGEILEARTLQHQTPLSAHGIGQLAKEAALSNTGFTADDDRRPVLRRLAGAKEIEQQVELFTTSQKSLEKRRSGDFQGAVNTGVQGETLWYVCRLSGTIIAKVNVAGVCGIVDTASATLKANALPLGSPAIGMSNGWPL
jgi:rubrerythrin